MNRMNERDASRRTSREAHLRKIQAVSFAKDEAALYLDAHPDCTAALDYYRKLLDEYKMLSEQYENEHGALTADSAAQDRWTWTEGIWPWQVDVKEG